jgi:hypothetical protein
MKLFAMRLENAETGIISAENAGEALNKAESCLGQNAVSIGIR